MPRLTLLLATLAALAAPATAAAADTTVAPDPNAQEATALSGTIVWVTDAPGGRQVLMQQTAQGIRPVTGAPPAAFYRSIDLGRDTRGQLVLTYMRCASPARCVVRRDDLAGHRAGVRGLTIRGCSLSTAPAIWRSRSAYGLSCRRGRTYDARRSGLYVKRRGAAPKRLPRPRDATRYGATSVTSADLRGTRAAAIVADIYAYAYSVGVNGKALRSALVATSEGDSDARARGLALGSGGDQWSLTASEHAGDPPQTIVHRLLASCDEYEVMTSPPQDQRFPAIDVAVDGRTVYLVVPGTGIVRHDFVPQRRCS
jgi:hypothetical protein